MIVNIINYMNDTVYLFLTSHICFNLAYVLELISVIH